MVAAPAQDLKDSVASCASASTGATGVFHARVGPHPSGQDFAHVHGREIERALRSKRERLPPARIESLTDLNVLRGLS